MKKILGMILTGILLLAVGYASGRYSAPTKIVERTVTVSHYDEKREAAVVAEAVAKISEQKTVVATKRIEKKKDGTVVADYKTETRYNLEANYKTEQKAVVMSEVSATQRTETEKIIESAKPRYIVGGAFTIPSRVYVIQAGVSLIGPLWLTSSVSLEVKPKLTIGLSILF